MKLPCLFMLCMPALITMVSAGSVRAEDVDGHYKGTYNSTGSCSGGGPTEMMIRDRSFTRRFGPNQQFEATVSPEGSVTGQFGQSSLSGIVKNGHVELDMASGRGCRVHEVMDKG